MDHLTELFCLIDNFCQVWEPLQRKKRLSQGKKSRNRRGGAEFVGVDDAAGAVSPDSLQAVQDVLLQPCQDASDQGVPWAAQLPKMRRADAEGMRSAH